jgi:hypothetical protein
MVARIHFSGMSNMSLRAELVRLCLPWSCSHGMHRSEALRRYGIHDSTLATRLKAGWFIERALTQPVRRTA